MRTRTVLAVVLGLVTVGSLAAMDAAAAIPGDAVAVPATAVLPAPPERTPPTVTPGPVPTAFLPSAPGQPAPDPPAVTTTVGVLWTISPIEQTTNRPESVPPPYVIEGAPNAASASGVVDAPTTVRRPDASVEVAATSPVIASGERPSGPPLLPATGGQPHVVGLVGLGLVVVGGGLASARFRARREVPVPALFGEDEGGVSVAG
jgi:hypothetical protein